MEERWQDADVSRVVAVACGGGCSCLGSAQGSVWGQINPLREQLGWVRALLACPWGAICPWPRPPCAALSPPVTMQGAGAAEIRLPKELGVPVETAAHPACTPLCPQPLLGAWGDGWVTSTLRNNTSLVQLLLSQGKDGADVTGPTGVIIHIFGINQQL